MLSPAAYDLACRKKRIRSTPDRTGHLTPRSMEFFVIGLSLAVSTASCRQTLTAHMNQLSFSGFGEIAIYRSNKAYQLSCPSNDAV